MRTSNPHKCHIHDANFMMLVMAGPHHVHDNSSGSFRIRKDPRTRKVLDKSRARAQAYKYLLPPALISISPFLPLITPAP
jgi:hypothetical protein